jgi:predicted transcriptional regulator
MAIDNLVSRLSELSQRVDALVMKKNQLIGERTAIQTRLKDEFNITSSKQAKARIDELDTLIREETARLENLLTEIDAGVTRIENDIR